MEEQKREALENLINRVKSGKPPDECFVRLSADIIYDFSPQEQEWAIEILSTLRTASETLEFSSLLRTISLGVASMVSQRALAQITCKCPACGFGSRLLEEREYIDSSALKICESACSVLKEPNQFLMILARALLGVSLSFDNAVREHEGMKKGMKK